MVIVLAFFGAQRLRYHPVTVTTANLRAVTSEPGLEWQPALSPDGSQVAFVANRGGRQSLVIRSTRGAAGSGEATPTEGVDYGSEWEPTWSHDNESVRFVACAGTFFDCTWREAARLGGSARVLDLPRNDALWTSWSPDGSHVAFIAGRDSLVSYATDDGSTMLLAPPDGRIKHSPTWSPDGRRIAYVVGSNGVAFGFQLGGQTIWMVDADAGEPVRVTDASFVAYSPAWLDNDHLLFVSIHDGPEEVYVVRVTATGPRGAPQKVAGLTDAHSISYSAAGRQLAFAKTSVRQNIWSYPTGPGVTSIADGHPVTTENAVIEAHDVSRDGRRLVYSSNLRGNRDVYTRPVEGGTPTRLADSPDDEFDPRWSPDGTEIAFHVGVRKAQMIALMVVSADGASPRQVANAPSTWMPMWSPSGLQLAFSAGGGGEPMNTWVVSREAIGGAWGKARQLTDFACQPSDWAPDGSGVLCVVDGQGAGAGGPDASLVLVSPEGDVLWRYDPKADGLTLPNLYQRFSRNGSTIFARARREDGTEGIWAIPFRGGEPRLVVAYDDATLVPNVWLTVGPDRLYLSVAEYESDIWVADVEVER